MKAFIKSDRTSSTNADCLLPKVAGQALAMLAMENVLNCLIMMKEPEFISKLKSMIMIPDEKYIYVAASLLRSMCQHAQAKLTESDLKELSHTLREVLERILNAEGAELEIPIGLSSQICKVIPEEFAQELEGGQIKRRFMKRLVDALNANINPGAHCPGIRRVILEQSIYMMEYNSHYASCFNEFRMMEALSMVEETPLRAENYRIILGDIGLMEYNTPLFVLVDRAKEMISLECLLGYWSIPNEQQLTDQDLLPALGMSIVDNLASGDENNSVEIDRATNLILKIIGFTSFRKTPTTSEAQQTVLVKSSLKVLQRLTSIGGEIGVALRYKIIKNPFLLRNLADILRDNSSDQELSKLVAGILRNLAIDGDTRKEIGQMQVIITRLMKAFIKSDRTSSTNVDCLLPKVAGQALAMLAMDNVLNCLVMMKEPEFISKLKSMIMIPDEKYIYVAASLLRSMCQNAQAKLTKSDLKGLSHTLREVLERILNAEGAELEILIGLSSQICKVIPEEFAQELEDGQIKRRFMKRLVDALNANVNPGANYPGIRRVILEQSIYMMESNSRYASSFNEFRMIEALSMVEETPLRAENYRIILGDIGFMEYNTPLFALVDRAKEMISLECLHDQQKQAAAAPEKWLNCFVRVVALMERTGNALGTLAFTWATVIVLGGYPTMLHSEDEFGYATTIIFIEAARMFSSSNNRIDYQLFFRTRGAFRPYAGWNGLTMVACISNAMLFTVSWGRFPEFSNQFQYVLVMLLLATIQFLCSAASRLITCNPVRRAISLWSPMVAILLLGPYVLKLYIDPNVKESKNTMPKWMVACAPVDNHVTLKLCIIASIMMPILMSDASNKSLVIILEATALVLVSFGNLQIPAATVRIVIAVFQFTPRLFSSRGPIIERNPEDEINLDATLTIFYGMVLGQGILYMAACIFEFFSFIPRRSLIRHGGFGGQWGVASVNLYYAYAFEKYMEGGVLAPKKISLITFAIDSLNSESPKMQLYSVQMMHIFLQREPTKERLMAKLTTSTKTMARLISMLGWTSPSHRAVRLYAAKATVELAKILQVATVPGTVELTSSLLDIDGKLKRRNPLLDADGDIEGKQDPIHNASESPEERKDANMDADDDQCRIQEPLRDTDSLLLETQTRSSPMKEHNSIFKRWQWISEYWSIPTEQQLTDHDLLPALGMSIVENLANGDQNNSVEIDRVTDLVPKIIGFTSFKSVTENSGAQKLVLVKSSLKVLQRLTSIEGEIGIALRHKISRHPFLIINLAEILGDNNNDQELIKLVAGILRNLAIDGNTRQEIGHMQVLITRLMKEFLSLDRTSNTNVDCLLPKVAGQALAMLATDNMHNCLVMLKEQEFINKLKNMILSPDENYIYVAASLLRSMCQHARAKLTESDLKELSHALREVLERIMSAEGAELEILIGLCTQICKVNPEEFSQELEGGQIKKRFMKRLVDSLNANMKPCAHCPGIRRVILEQSIYMMECNSHNVSCFNEFRMMDALSMVEETPSRAENYRLFLGDTGLMEYKTPLFALVDRAKELIGRQCLQVISNAN
uniref:BLE2 protein n=1 Tax=Leersia perrieri TaxID=77586 RepID=A0A0D9X2A1_9ORYZ